MNIHNLAIVGYGEAFELSSSDFLHFEYRRSILVLLIGEAGGDEDLLLEEV